MDVATIEHLLKNICLLLQSKTRDVVKSALSLIKVVLFVMDTSGLAPQLPLLVSPISDLYDRCQISMTCGPPPRQCPLSDL